MERENLQTRWVLMASQASKFDSKKAVPGAQDTTRLRKSFRADSREEVWLGPTRNVRAIHRDREAASTFRDLFRCDWCSRLEKEKRREIIGGSLTSRFSIKRKELSSFDYRELDRFVACRKFWELASQVKRKSWLIKYIFFFWNNVINFNMYLICIFTRYIILIIILYNLI